MKTLNWIRRLVVTGMLMFYGDRALMAQGQPCGAMPYLQQDRFSRVPIEMAQVQGTASDQNGWVIAQVCVGIFTMDDRKLLRSAQTDAHGAFSIDIKGLPDGTYRLVGYLLGFCPANAILTINSHAREKKPLAVRMNLPGNPDCSTVEVRKK
jgi:hypothetical protein